MKKNRIIRNTFILFLVSGFNLATLATAADLNECKTAYQKKLDEIIAANGSNGVKMLTINQQFTNSLNALFVKVQKAGDLDKTIAVKKEIERFTKEKTMPDEPTPLQEISNIQSSYTNQTALLEISKCRQIVSLTQSYDQTLERLQTALVKSGRIDDANAVKAERENAKDGETYLTAKAIVEKANELKSVPDVADAGSKTTTSLGKMAGVWKVSYRNDFWRIIKIDSSGGVEVLSAAPGWSCQGVRFGLTEDKKNGKILSTSNDLIGAIESYRLSGKELMVERWNPGSSISATPDNTGVGTKVESNN